MSLADVVNWPDRIDEFMFIRDNDRGRGLINALEEVVLEDTSATEDFTGITVEPVFDGQPLPRGIIMVRMRYDGQSDRQLVLDHWSAIHEVALDAHEVLRDSRQRSPAAQQAFDEHMRRRRQHGELITRRQREAAARRRQEQERTEQTPEFRIQWHDATVWHTPDGAGRYPVGEMDDAFLWHTVIWLVRNQVRLAYIYSDTPPHVTPALAAAIWLRQQPAFRGLLKESIRRNFTFPQDVFNYCKQYVLDRSLTLDGYQPWQDPGQTAQPKALENLLTMPDVPPELAMNKDLRSIEL